MSIPSRILFQLIPRDRDSATIPQGDDHGTAIALPGA
jgi:hypothetical protein